MRLEMGKRDARASSLEAKSEMRNAKSGKRKGILFWLMYSCVYGVCVRRVFVTVP